MLMLALTEGVDASQRCSSDFTECQVFRCSACVRHFKPALWRKPSRAVISVSLAFRATLIRGINSELLTFLNHSTGLSGGHDAGKSERVDKSEK